MQEPPHGGQIGPDCKNDKHALKSQIHCPDDSGSNAKQIYEGIEDAGDSQQYYPLASLEYSHKASFAQPFGACPRVADHQRAEENQQDQQGVERRGIMAVEIEQDTQIDQEFGVSVQDRIQKSPEFFA